MQGSRWSCWSLVVRSRWFRSRPAGERLQGSRWSLGNDCRGSPSRIAEPFGWICRQGFGLCLAGGLAGGRWGVPAVSRCGFCRRFGWLLVIRTEKRKRKKQTIVCIPAPAGVYSHGVKRVARELPPLWGRWGALNLPSDNLFCLGILLAAGVAPPLCPPSKRVAKTLSPSYGVASAILNRIFWGFSMG